MLSFKLCQLHLHTGTRLGAICCDARLALSNLNACAQNPLVIFKLF